jgi:SAM-dependent methyltransferase
VTLDREHIERARSAQCAACERPALVAFYHGGSVPAHSCVLLDDASEAGSYPMGEMLLACCSNCGFVQNVAFDVSLIDYGQDCEESQAFSPAFNAFANGLAKRLVTDLGLAGRRVLEVGCGKGDFLALLAAEGMTGIGIDPGYRHGRQVDPGLEFIIDTFDERYTHLTGDLVATRHTLEHVPDVARFTRHLLASTTATPGASLFIEVPDAIRVLRDGAFWDVYHEHCSYFSLGSLGRMLRHVGAPALELELAFEDQYLLALARPDAAPVVLPTEEPVTEMVALSESFTERVGAVISDWRTRIAQAAREGRRPVLWGGGSKAIAFVAALGLDDAIAGVVDINPHKQGKFLAGSGLEVMAPERLPELDTGLVVIMNPIYVGEISAMIDTLGLAPEIDSVT